MSLANYFSGTIITALAISWLLTNFVFKAGPGVDLTFFAFLLILSFYRTKNASGLAGTFVHVGLRPLKRRDVMAATALAAALLVLSQLLAAALRVDLAELTGRQKSVGQMGYWIVRDYAPAAAAVILVIQTFWVTFFEEFFYRGVLLRVVNPYHHLTALLLQAGLFGFMHVAGSLWSGLAGNALAYMFLYPTLAALLLGYVYLRAGQNLTLVWTAHFLVNTTTWLVFVYTGVIF